MSKVFELYQGNLYQEKFLETKNKFVLSGRIEVHPHNLSDDEELLIDLEPNVKFNPPRKLIQLTIPETVQQPARVQQPKKQKDSPIGNHTFIFQNQTQRQVNPRSSSANLLQRKTRNELPPSRQYVLAYNLKGILKKRRKNQKSINKTKKVKFQL